MKERAYDGVRSKIARNIKVIDKVNRAHGYHSHYLSPYKRPLTATQMAPMSARSRRSNTTMNIPADSSRGERAERSWQRNCTNYNENTSARRSPIKSQTKRTKTGGVDYLKLNKEAESGVMTELRHMCCCHASPRNRSRLEIINEYDRNIKKLRSPSNLSFKSRTAIETTHTASVADLTQTSARGKIIKKAVSKKKKKKAKKKKVVEHE